MGALLGEQEVLAQFRGDLEGIALTLVLRRLGKAHAVAEVALPVLDGIVHVCGVILGGENRSAVHMIHLAPIQVIGRIAGEVDGLAVLGITEHPLDHQAFGVVLHVAEPSGDLGNGERTGPHAGIIEITVEQLRGRIIAAVSIPGHAHLEALQEEVGGTGSIEGIGVDELAVVVDVQLAFRVDHKGEDVPHFGLADVEVGLTLLRHLQVQTPLVVVDAEGAGSGVVAAEADQEGRVLVRCFEAAKTVNLVSGLPTVGIELHLEGAALLEVVGVLLGKQEVLGEFGHNLEDIAVALDDRIGRELGLLGSLTGLLGDGDGLEGLLGTGADDLHFTGADFLGGVVIDLEDDGVVGGAGLHEVDPVHLRLHVESDVGDGVGLDGGVLGLGDVVDVAVGDLELVGLGLGTEGEFHDGGQAHLGVGIGEGGTLRDDERGDGDLGSVDGGLIVGVGEDVHDGVLGPVLHGVGDLDRVRGSHGVLGLRDDELEGLGEGNLDGGVIVQGEDHGIGRDLDVLEDGITQAAAHGAEVGGLTVHGHQQMAVLHGEGRGLAHGEVLAVHLDDFAVQGPAEDAGGIADGGEVGLGTGAGDLEGDDLAGRVGDGHAHDFAVLGKFFDALDEHAVGRRILEGLHVGLEVAHLGLQGRNPVAELGVIVLAGAPHEEEPQCESSK